MNMRRMISGWIAAVAGAVPALATALFLSIPASAFPAEDQAQSDAQESKIRESVVKISATMRYPDLTHPWTKHSPQDASGTGVVIDGKRILTNAHVVLYASQLFVESYQSSDKLPAKVEAVSPGIDLAVLRLEDESFFDKRPPLARTSTLPEVKETVLVYGYPQGGSTLSITKGIVSRIEFAGYGEGTSGVRVQIDAAINPGNSGGPALIDGKMVGLIFSKLTQADNIGYIIPSEEIDLFLKDVADGTYDGKPAIHESLQTLENEALRSFLNLDKKAQGMVVHSVDPSDPEDPLKPFDLITKIGDHEIDNVGMVKIKENLRLNFHYLIQKVVKHGKVPADDRSPGQVLGDRAAGQDEVPDADRVAQGAVSVVLHLRPAGIFSGDDRVRRVVRPHGPALCGAVLDRQPAGDPPGRSASVRRRGTGRGHLANVSPPDRQGLRQPVLQDRQGG